MRSLSDFSVWDIWLARVAFEDQPEILKVRPVLILGEDGRFVLTVKITSHPPRNNFEGGYRMVGWQDAGLLKPSTIRLSRRLSLPVSAFIKRIGTLQEADCVRIKEII